MSVNVAGHMARKSVTKDMRGNIINMIDEKDGGWIVRDRQIVNIEKWNELVKQEEDRKKAALAATEAIAVSPELAALRNKAGVSQEELAKVQSGQSTDKMQEFENRLNKQDEKLDAILNLLKK